MHARLTMLSSVLLAVIALVMGGCSSYAVRGVVVMGSSSYVEIVDDNDPRLTQGQPIAGAVVRIMIDPSSLNPTRLSGVTSGAVGEFAIPVDSFGAGWPEYELGVVVRRPGFAPAEGFFQLPPSGKRLLVTLGAGQDRRGLDDSGFDEGYDYNRDLERFEH